MNVYDAVMQRRTIRKFAQTEVPEAELKRLVDMARVAAYGANVQPLKFALILGENRDKIFPFIKWAGALKDGAPKADERPAAYIAVLGDRSIRAQGGFEVDAGAAVTTMILGAMEMGLASCWLGAIDRKEIKSTLGLGVRYDLVYLLAIGYPKQKSRMVEMKNGSFAYYESDDGTINVPKRALDEVLVEI